MATIEENLNIIETVKTNIRNSIINKGVEVAESDSFTSYPSFIDNITTGGSGGEGVESDIDKFYKSNGMQEYLSNKKADELKEIEDIKIVWKKYGITVDDTNYSKLPTFNSTITYLPKLNNITKNTIFQGYKYIKTIPELNPIESYTSFENMYASCENLEYIPFIDTSKVTNMYYAFNSCSSLKKIPNIDTSKVTNFNSCFYNCSSLKDIPELDTTSATSVNYMFRSCIFDKDINLNIPNVESITNLFSFGGANNVNLTTSDKLTNLDSAFWYTNYTKKITISNTSKVTNFDNCFKQCSELKEIGLLDCSSCTSFNDTFTSSGSISIISFVENSIKAAIDFSKTRNLTQESINSIVNGCATLSLSTNIYFNGYNYSGNTNNTTGVFVSEEQVAELTAKGWTVGFNA